MDRLPLAATSITVLLADFGASRRVEHVPEAADGGIKELVGTYQFRAPETFVIGGTYGYPNDVWGLGVLVLWVDLGRCLFRKCRGKASF